VLRVTPERLGSSSVALPVALRETLPNLRADVAVALVCAGNRCYPPVDRSEKLAELLGQIDRESQAAAG
jgi:uncharacterized protein YyaL (SSP411 family)